MRVPSTLAAMVPSPALAVPASLQASLMARLDRLGPAKEVAQIGSVIGREFSHALLAAVVRKPEAELNAALQRLIAAGLLFRQGVPPHAIYLFKHALVQDAAYGTLLREPRRALHARIAEMLESQFADIAERQPELLARHFTEAGLIEKAAGLWGKAGQRSLARSALIEAAQQLARALGQIATLPGTPALRREEIKLQVALINSLMHVKGYAAPETKAATEKARLLIEKAEALGEPPDDPLMLFSVLYGFWGASYNVFNGGAVCELAGQFLALAEKQGATVPLMIGRRLMGSSLLLTGEVAESRVHFDQALALHDPAKHRPLDDPFWSGHRCVNLDVSVTSPVVAGLPRVCTRRRRPWPQGCTGDRSCTHPDDCAGRHYPYPLRELRDSKHEPAGSCCFGGRERRHLVAGARNVLARLPFCRDRRSLEFSPHDQHRGHSVAVNGIDSVHSVVFVIFGDRLCRAR